MSYASVDDLSVRFTAQEIEALSDGDEDVVKKALNDASKEADSYLAVSNSLPLPAASEALNRVVCDIARYLLYTNKSPEEVRKRYEDAISWLKRIADKKAALVFDSSVVSPNIQPPLQTDTSPISATYVGGVFSNDMLDKML